jgi:hypothetical protein
MSHAEIEHPEAYAAAVKSHILQNARKTWVKNNPRAGEIMDFFHSGARLGEFMHDMSLSLDTYGKLSEKQTAAVLKSIDGAAARKAQWAAERATADAGKVHLGAVGEKLTVELTVVHIVVLDGHWGTTYMHICEDAAGNVVVYKGKADAFPNKGHSAVVTATVKEHARFAGVAQTIIQRPKCIPTGEPK